MGNLGWAERKTSDVAHMHEINGIYHLVSKTETIPAEAQGSREHGLRTAKENALGTRKCHFLPPPLLHTGPGHHHFLPWPLRQPPTSTLRFTLTWLQAALHLLVNTILQKVTQSSALLLRSPRCLPTAPRIGFTRLARPCATLRDPALASVMTLSPVTVPPPSLFQPLVFLLVIEYPKHTSLPGAFAMGDACPPDIFQAAPAPLRGQ